MRLQNNTVKSLLFRNELRLILLSLGALIVSSVSFPHLVSGDGARSQTTNYGATRTSRDRVAGLPSASFDLTENGKGSKNPSAKKNKNGSSKNRKTGKAKGAQPKKPDANETQGVSDQSGNADNKPSPTPSPANVKAEGGDKGQTAKICAEVMLGPLAPDPDSLAKKFDGVGDVSVKSVGGRTLLLCGPPANFDVVRRAVQGISGARVTSRAHETHAVRLFFFRHAPDIAAAINNSAGLSTPVKALGDDLLVFPSESDADDEAIHKLKRWIAMIDKPRPEISLLAWSAQISSGNADVINQKSNLIHSTVSEFNDGLQQALERGWFYLKMIGKDPNFFAPTFRKYLSNRYIFPASPYLRNRYYFPPSGAGPESSEPACGNDDNQYCLGYTHIFDHVRPSLSGMLLALIAAQNNGAVIQEFVNQLEDLPNRKIFIEGRPRAPKQWPKISEDIQLAAEGGCEQQDDTRLKKREGISFSCFRKQLEDSLTKQRLAEIRVALADFLFNYKSAEQYPEDFVTWNQGASAQALDSNLAPLIVAFNRDIAVYLRYLQEFIDETKEKKEKKVSFSVDGIITAEVLSGSPVTVDTTTQSYFRMPPTVSARDLVGAFGNSGGNSSNSSSGLSLSPFWQGHAAELLAAAIQAEQRKTSKIGRTMSLQVTANSLAGASACEMDVTLNSGEGDTPKLLNTSDKSSADENLNRVAKHTITTKVRVDSQKLFEISSFAAALQHGRSVPLIPPFVDLPYIGNVARLRLSPGTVFHRSFAIVSAVIVPTAADLANRIEFRADLEPGHLDSVVLENDPPGSKDIPQKGKNEKKRKGGEQKDDDRDLEKTKPVYYWIVAHYHEGYSISGPFLVAHPPKQFDDDHALTLFWKASDKVLTFDVLRTRTEDRPSAGPCHKCLVAEEITGTSIRDYKNDAELKNYTVPSELGIYRAMTRPLANMRVFHRDMLECIREEALDATTHCGAGLKLSETPVDRP